MTFKNWIRDRFFSYKSDGEKGEASQEELLSKEQTVQEEQQVDKMYYCCRIFWN